MVFLLFPFFKDVWHRRSAVSRPQEEEDGQQATLITILVAKHFDLRDLAAPATKVFGNSYMQRRISVSGFPAFYHMILGRARTMKRWGE
jgi:hypothetical protein